MSTITGFPVSTVHRRISAATVRAALESVVADHPHRADRRTIDTRPRYVRADGRPACLVAEVLTRLGFSTGVLKALDEEHPTGNILDTGVTLTESGHPALKKLHRDALLLLGYVQARQEQGVRWGRILRDAFQPRRLFRRRRDRRSRPWLT
jgi:hypothetical protein